MKRAITIYGFCFALAGFCLGEQPRASYDPAKQAERKIQNQSFIDFTLRRLNGEDKDYGECFAEARLLLTEETIRSGYFWSNAVSLGVALCLIVVVIYQHQQRTIREWTMAEVLQQFDHALSRANAQVDAATIRNSELIEALRLRQSMVQVAPVAPERQRLEPGADRENSKSMPEASVNTQLLSPVPRVKKTAQPLTVAGDQISLFRPEVDLVLKVNSLEQQLEHSQEQQKQLRRQLTQTDQRLQAEQSKNRTLKGA